MTFSKFFKPAMMLGCLLLATTAHAERFLYTGGHELDPVRMGMLGDTFTEFYADDAGWSAALSGGLGTYKAIVVGESQPSISAGTAAAIASYVSNGGHLVVVNNHQGSTDFVNGVLGYSVVANYGCMSEEGISSSLQNATATGTAFVSGASNLRNLSCTAALNLNSLPAGAKSIYSAPGTTQAFTSKYGSGQFAWLAWDYCCGSSPYENDWYHVLAAAVAPSFKACAAAGNAGGKLVLCQQICEVRQTPTVRAALTKAYFRAYHQNPTCTVELPLNNNNL